MTDNGFDLIVRGDIVTHEAVMRDGYIAIRDGKVAAVGTGEAPAALQTHDYPDAFLFPGLIDAQVHAGSREGLPGLADATRSAAAGGVTTIVDMPFDRPLPVDNPQAMDTKIAAIADLAWVDVALYVTARKDGPTDVAAMAAKGACGVKVSTYEYDPVRFPRFGTGEMYDIFRQAAAVDLPVAFHNEDQELVNHLTKAAIAQHGHSPAAHGASRPPFVELVANAHILELALHTGVRCHIVHSSVAEGFDMVRAYRARGGRVTAETCIQYLVFNEDDMVRHGAFLKQNPPLRADVEVHKLWDVLARGDVDLVSTDHVAWRKDNKSDPDIFKNGAGVPGLEAFLPVFFSGIVERGLPVTIIAGVAALNPARHFGLYPQKGHLGPGADADIAVVTREEGCFRADEIVSEVGWSPYDGFKTAGSVTATYLRGERVFNRSEGVTQKLGRYTPRVQAIYDVKQSD